MTLRVRGVQWLIILRPRRMRDRAGSPAPPRAGGVPRDFLSRRRSMRGAKLLIGAPRGAGDRGGGRDPQLSPPNTNRGGGRRGWCPPSARIKSKVPSTARGHVVSQTTP